LKVGAVIEGIELNKTSISNDFQSTPIAVHGAAVAGQGTV
jgi:hypothetical protein